MLPSPPERKKDMEKLIRLLPNFYYHLVGRLIPGAAVLACLVFFPSTRSLVLDPDGGYVWTVILIGGYTLGLMLSTSSTFVFDVLSRLYSAPAYPEYRQPLTARIGEIARKDSRIALIFWKMTAEKVLFENLFIGSVCLAVVDTYSLGFRTPVMLFWLCLLLGLYFVSLERTHLLLVRMAQSENLLKIKRPFMGHDVAALGV